jgi:putative aldouronate transport system permease protein
MYTKEDKAIQWLANSFMAVMAALCLIPFFLLVVSSFTDETVILKNGYSFFASKWSLAAYEYLGRQAMQLTRAYGITILVTVIGTTVSILITSMLAYSLSRQDLPLRKAFNFLVVFSILFNGGLVPTYLVYTRFIGIKNTIYAQIVPGLLMNGFNVLLVKSYFMTNIPPALIESAKLDGAGELTIFRKIVFPLSLPIIATIGLLSGIAYWNDWFNGLIYITNSRLFSIQNILNRILLDVQFLSNNDMGSYGGDAATNIPSTTVRMAIAVVGAVPILIAYPFFQKYFIKGITLGAIKG